MEKQKKQRLIKRLVIIVALLGVAEMMMLFLFRPTEAKDSLASAVRRAAAGNPKNTDILRVQAAVAIYMGQHSGKPPSSLTELVPTYLDRIPRDQATGREIEYRVVNGKPFVGAPQAASSTEATQAPATMAEANAALNFIYDPTGKRDPFAPYDFAPKVDTTDKTPLETYDIGQLKLTAVLKDLDGNPFANVENSVGRGFTIRKGTKIGIHGGEVSEILADRVVIVEMGSDPLGRPKPRNVELRLRTKDQEKKPTITR